LEKPGEHIVLKKDTRNPLLIETQHYNYEALCANPQRRKSSFPLCQNDDMMMGPHSPVNQDFKVRMAAN